MVRYVFQSSLIFHPIFSFRATISNFTKLYPISVVSDRVSNISHSFHIQFVTSFRFIINSRMFQLRVTLTSFLLTVHQYITFITLSSCTLFNLISMSPLFGLSLLFLFTLFSLPSRIKEIMMVVQ